jgi:hypothetical protein
MRSVHVYFNYSSIPLLHFCLTNVRRRHASRTSCLARSLNSWINFKWLVAPTFPLQSITGKLEPGIELMIHSTAATAGCFISQFPTSHSHDPIKNELIAVAGGERTFFHHQASSPMLPQLPQHVPPYHSSTLGLKRPSPALTACRCVPSRASQPPHRQP